MHVVYKLKKVPIHFFQKFLLHVLQLSSCKFVQPEANAERSQFVIYGSWTKKVYEGKNYNYLYDTCV